MAVRNDFASGALTDLLFAEPGVARCLVAPDGSVLRANAEWLRSTGLALDDVLGADIISLFPDTRDMALALHARVRAGHHVEVPRHAQTVNGRESWWEGSIDPVPMDGGTGLLVSAREVTTRRGEATAGVRADVTEPKRSEEDLAHEKEKYRSLFDHSLDAVYLTTADGTILEANAAACRLHGMTVEEIIQAGRAGLVVNDERHRMALRERATAGRARAELTIRRKDGSTVPVEVESVLLEPRRHGSRAFVISPSRRPVPTRPASSCATSACPACRATRSRAGCERSPRAMSSSSPSAGTRNPRTCSAPSRPDSMGTSRSPATRRRSSGCSRGSAQGVCSVGAGRRVSGRTK